MQGRRTLPGWLGLVALLLPVPSGAARAQETPVVVEKQERSGLFPWRNRSRTTRAATIAAHLELDLAPEEQKGKAMAVLDRPVLQARGPMETFYCQPEMYQFLLDHPDRAAKMWRKFGAQCADITALGDGRFSWKDDQGSQLVWQAIVRTPRLRVWYAEGSGKPGPLLPTVSVKAVVVMHLQEGRDANGRRAVRHQGELFLQTDNKAFGLITRMLGGSVQRMAEQYVGQVETFFAGLAYKLEEKPERARELMDSE